MATSTRMLAPPLCRSFSCSAWISRAMASAASSAACFAVDFESAAAPRAVGDFALAGFAAALGFAVPLALTGLAAPVGRGDFGPPAASFGLAGEALGPRRASIALAVAD